MEPLKLFFQTNWRRRGSAQLNPDDKQRLRGGSLCAVPLAAPSLGSRAVVGNVITRETVMFLFKRSSLTERRPRLRGPLISLPFQIFGPLVDLRVGADGGVCTFALIWRIRWESTRGISPSLDFVLGKLNSICEI